MRLSTTPLVTMAALSAVVSAEVAAGDFATNTALGAKADTADLADYAAVSDLNDLASAVRAGPGWPLSCAADQTGVTGTVLTDDFDLASGLTLVPQHSYRLGVNITVETLLRAAIAQVSVRDVVAVYVPHWDTSLSYAVGDRVVAGDVGSDGIKRIWRCVTATDNTDTTPSDGDGNWVVDGLTAYNVAQDPGPAWFVIEKGTVKANTETGYGTYFATTDTTPADAIPDDLPYVSDNNGALGYACILLNTQQARITCDGTLADLGINH